MKYRANNSWSSWIQALISFLEWIPERNICVRSQNLEISINFTYTRWTSAIVEIVMQQEYVRIRNIDYESKPRAIILFLSSIIVTKSTFNTYSKLIRPISKDQLSTHRTHSSSFPTTIATAILRSSPFKTVAVVMVVMVWVIMIMSLILVVLMVQPLSRQVL